MATKEELRKKYGIKPKDEPAVSARPMTAGIRSEVEPRMGEPTVKPAEAATNVQGPTASLIAAARPGLPARGKSPSLEDEPESDLDTPVFSRPSPQPLPSRSGQSRPSGEYGHAPTDYGSPPTDYGHAPEMPAEYELSPEDKRTLGQPAPGSLARKPSARMEKLKAFGKKYFVIPAVIAAFVVGMMVDCNCRGPKVVKTTCVDPIQIKAKVPAPKPVPAPVRLPVVQKPKCGDGICNENDNAKTCATDCETKCGDGFVTGKEQCEPKPNEGEAKKCKTGSVCSKADCMCKKRAPQSAIQPPGPQTSCLVKTAGPATYAPRHYDVRDFLNTSAASLQGEIGDERLIAVTALCKANQQAVVISVKGQNNNNALYRKVMATLNASLKGKKFVIVEGQVVKVNIPIKVQ